MKRITELTEEQRARLGEWREKWIKVGLSTEKMDLEKFKEGVVGCYEAAKLAPPKIVIKVPSPLVLALAGPTAAFYFSKLSAVGSAVNSAIGSAVNSAVNSAVYSAVNSAVDLEVHSEVNSEVRSAVESAVYSEVGSAVNSAVYSAVNSAVESEVGSEVNSAVRSAVGLAVRSAVNSAVDSAVGSAVESAVDLEVHSAVDSAVDSAVNSAVYSAVNSAVDLEVGSAIKNSWHRYLGGQFWVGGWYGSPCHVSFFTDVCGLELPVDIAAAGKAYQKTSENGCWWWPHSQFCFVSERPHTLLRDDRGRLHHLNGPAIAWEGFEIFAIHGVRFQRDLYHKVSQNKITAKEILQLENIEQRMCALKIKGAEALLQELEAKQIDSSAASGNELYLLQNVFSTPAYYIKYSCPSTGRVYVSGVDPKVGIDGDADKAMAWKFGLTKDEYLSIEMQS